MEFARKLDVKILRASTSEIYRNPEISPQPESYWGNINSFGFKSYYNKEKRVVENLFVDYDQNMVLIDELLVYLIDMGCSWRRTMEEA
jgi:hypothetical protein